MSIEHYVVRIRRRLFCSDVSFCEFYNVTSFCQVFFHTPFFFYFL
nr:MAG TPA: hypothetical protein [Caudoviricetes sp.]